MSCHLISDLSHLKTEQLQYELHHHVVTLSGLGWGQELEHYD